MNITQCLNLSGLTGATVGAFDPTKLATEILGDLEAGPAFAYLFRRFGYPAHGWDDYKELAEYILTTPMERVCLYASVRGCGVSFGYLIPEGLEMLCQREEREPYDAWHSRFNVWTTEQGITLITRFDTVTNPAKVKRLADEWLAERHETDWTDELDNQFWQEQHKKHKEARDQYAAIEPFPEPEGIYGETRLKVWDAFGETLRDLLRPVYVRDVWINIKGRVDPSDEMEPVEPSSMAGNGIGYLYEIYSDQSKRERWFNAIEAVAAVGDGDLLAGIEELIKGETE